MLLNENEIKAVGCLVGGAVGDALGYPVEFYSDELIFKKYGERGITEYRLTNGSAQISDDTQMSMFTAEGLLDASGDDGVVASVYKAYLNWLKTQNCDAPVSATGLLSIPALYSCRAPGNTCLGALESGMCGTLDYPINRSKGCGGVMRVAPIAVYCYNRGISCADAAMLGARVSAITHGHELGYIPSAFLVHIIYRILEGAELSFAVDDAIRTLPTMFPASEYMSEALDLLNRAVALAAQDCDDLDGIRELGGGWVAEQTLAIAVYCALKHQDSFEDTVIAAVNHSGDSDSTGAVAGNIIGAYLGVKSIPKKYLDGLELLETIVPLTLRLCASDTTC